MRHECGVSHLTEKAKPPPPTTQLKPSVSCRSSEVRVALERRGRDAALVTLLSQPGKQKSALESSTVSTFLRSEKIRRSFCSFRPETSTVCQATYRGTCGIGTTRALAQLFPDHQGSLVTKSSSWIGHSLKFLRSEIRKTRRLGVPRSLAMRAQTTVGGVCQRWPIVGQRQKAGLAWIMCPLPLW